MVNLKIKLIGNYVKTNRSGYKIGSTIITKYVDIPNDNFIDNYCDCDGNVSENGLKYFNNTYCSKIITTFSPFIGKIVKLNDSEEYNYLKI